MRPVAVERMSDRSLVEPLDYEKLVDMFNRALLHTLRKHSIAGGFLDFWVPDADPVLGIASMVDSARIGGLTTVAIRFQNSTVPIERLPELEQVLAKFCKPTLEKQGDGVLLIAADIGHDTGTEVVRVVRSKPTYWQADVAANIPQSGIRGPAEWDYGGLSEFGDVNPHFRSRLKAALGAISYEDDADQASADTVKVMGRERGAMLLLAVDSRTHKVQTARHSGAAKPSEKVILDLFCKAAEKLPIQEVADHTALKVLVSLVDKDSAPPVTGVLLPANAGAPFTLPARLARQAYNAYRAQMEGKDGTNFYYAPPAVAWQGLSSTQRLEKAGYVLRAFLQSEGLYPDDMSVLRIEKNKYGYDVRVIIGFSERVATADKPQLMRRLEQRLRRDLEPEIDLVADRARDTSPLRRLS